VDGVVVIHWGKCRSRHLSTAWSPYASQVTERRVQLDEQEATTALGRSRRVARAQCDKQEAMTPCFVVSFLVVRERVEGLKDVLGDLGECVSGWKALVGSQ
jgi:hypothetical protein